MSWDNRRTPRSSKDVVDARTRRRVLERDNYRCQIADEGCTFSATEVDHFEPWFLGGGDEVENLRGVCHACHSKKTARESHLARRMNQRKALHRSARMPHPFYRD